VPQESRPVILPVTRYVPIGEIEIRPQALPL